MMRALFILFTCFCLFSFSAHRKKKLVPPGTVQITENFFVDDTEISNFSWREYEWWTAAKYGVNSPEHISVLPDTTVWRDKRYYNEPYVQYYYRHPAYKDYPVVGISYEQALAFCKWRTERVKQFYAIGQRKALYIEYRLPTKNEWEKFSFTQPLVPNLKTGLDYKGRRTLNCLAIPADTMGIAEKSNDNAHVTTPVY